MSLPNLSSRFLTAASAVLLLFTALACDVGGGSQVPPFLPGGPESYVSTPVINEANEPIVGALASAEGGSNSAAALRNGRFYLPGQPIGQARLTVDPRNGTATGTDEYPVLVYRPGIQGGKVSLMRPVVLPDLTKGTSAVLVLGTLTAPVSVDASSSAGARLDLASGTVLGLGAKSGSIKVSLARVEKDQLPLVLPASATGVLLAGRGIWLAPLDLGLTGGARTLTIDNDLGLGVGQKASLMRLDPVSGTWNQVGTGTVQSGGTQIQSDGGQLPGGGIYVFTTTVSVSTAVSGKVVDEAGKAIAGAHVIVAEAAAVLTDAQGDFNVPVVAQQNAGAAALQLPVLVLPPLGYAPAVKRDSFAATPNATNTGTIQTQSYPVANVQSIAVIRGRGLGHARILQGGGGQPPSVSQDQGSGDFSTSVVTQSGVVTRRDVPLGWYRAWHSFESNGELFRQQDDLVINTNPDFEFNGMTLFVRTWPTSSGEANGRTVDFVVDAEGGAPLEGAIVQSPTVATTTRIATVPEVGSVFNDTNRFEDQTAVYESKLPGGQQLRSALTTASIDNFRVEYPLKTLQRPSLGKYRPFGLIDGKVLSSMSGQDRKALPQPGYSTNDWFGLALTGQRYVEDLPRLLEPSTTSQSYLLGLPTEKASFVVSEGVTNSGVYTPQRLGVLTGLRPRAGSRLVQDVDLSLALSAQVTLQNVLPSLDTGIGTAALRYQLGATFGLAGALDLLPVSAGVVASGTDARVPVPPLTGPLAGANYLVAFGGTGVKSGATISQHLYLQTSQASVTPGIFLAPPAITSPAANSAVSKSGFKVSWTVPTGTYFLELDLRSVNGTDDRYWTVYLPADRTSFDFGPLVTTAPQILTGGRTWTLSLSAYSIDRGVAFGRPDGYQRLVGNLFALRPGERGIRARSVWSQTITTSP